MDATPTPHAQAAAWTAALARALQLGDAEAAAALFHPDGHWRDILALTWTLTNAAGRPAIRDALAAALPESHAVGLRLAPGRTPPRDVTRAGRRVVEAILAFETAAGTCAAVARLLPDPAAPTGLVAWTLVTTLEELHGHPEPSHARRSGDPDYSRDFGGQNWMDKRDRAASFDDRDPAVLVVGGGQAGLGIAARLKALGVDTLVIDRESRIGDNWRRRYHALTLHNEVHVNHLPYMPFPPTFPVFIPKDKLANFFEAYVDALDLPFWTATELTGGSYDESDHRWTVTLSRNGTPRTLRPRHLVFATGVSAIPVMPNIPGQQGFRGPILHSDAYTEGHAWRGKRALVLGTGNSGHDVAQDLRGAGAHVTMIQRSPTYVVSLREAQAVYSIYTEGLPIEDCDLLAIAMPMPVLTDAYRLATAASERADAALLDGLQGVGFRLEQSDGTGFQMMYLRRGGGYYFNVGCSDLIINGGIGLLQYDTIDRMVPEGVRLKDGTTLPADLLVAATGYLNQQDMVRHLLGDAVADRIGPVWGFDEGGELANMWKRTPQPGLWFTAGSLAQCRIWSRYLALQIKATEMGLIA
jgi:lactate dehydrogenase-like 2-hydroxyacid dehydrogenase